LLRIIKGARNLFRYISLHVTSLLGFFSTTKSIAAAPDSPYVSIIWTPQFQKYITLFFPFENRYTSRSKCNGMQYNLHYSWIYSSLWLKELRSFGPNSELGCSPPGRRSKIRCRRVRAYSGRFKQKVIHDGWRFLLKYEVFFYAGTAIQICSRPKKKKKSILQTSLCGQGPYGKG
jgi:hypothetical protein